MTVAGKALTRLLLAGLLLLSILPGALASEGVQKEQSRTKLTALVSELALKAEQQGGLRIIVGLDADFVPAGRLPATERATQQNRIAQQQDSLLARMQTFNAVERGRFRHIPFSVLQLDGQAIRHLASMDMVISVQEDVAESVMLASSNPVIGSDIAWAAGYDGSGWAVAVLDSGIDATHPFFSTPSKIVAEACFSSNDGNAVSLCPEHVEESTEPGSAGHCPVEVVNCYHGTHVAGVVAGNNLTGPEYGVARGASLIPVQVFSRFDDAANCGSANTSCALTYISDQVSALEWIYEKRDEFNIAAVNMSLGGASYTDPSACDFEQYARKTAVDNLRSVGIVTIAASGNSGSSNSLITPACISSVMSVGATTDADEVASFSDVATFLDFLAPGVEITSAFPGGTLAEKNGTSFAAPHVAGAWAVLKQGQPDSSIADIKAALSSAAVVVDDDRFGGAVTGMKRIDLVAALESLSQRIFRDDFE